MDQGQQEQGVVPEADVPEAHEEPPQVETFAREMQIEQIEDGGECSICFDELNSDDAERGIIDKSEPRKRMAKEGQNEGILGGQRQKS